MKSASAFLFIVLAVAVAYGDEPAVHLRDFSSEAAKLAVRTFTDRIAFLEQSMQQHVDSATNKLRDELKAALAEAAKQGDLKETELISKFLQAGVSPSNEADSIASHEKIVRLEKEIATLKQRLEAVTAPDPLAGTWRYENGNVCNFTTDGWVVLNGERIAAWKRLADNRYVAAFLNNFASGSSDEMVLNPDGKTITATSKNGKRFSINRVDKK